jgi:hypothetical protein
MCGTRTDRTNAMRHIPLFAALAAPLALGACVVPPPAGPTVAAMPGQGVSWDQFQQDVIACRGWAAQATGGAQPAVAAGNAAVGSAVVGTALGAGLGAAIGAASGAAGPGAAIGAATGLLAGTSVGAANAQYSGAAVQQQYDIAYAQCMTAHGNSVQMPQPAYAGYPYGYGYANYGYPAYYPAYSWAVPSIIIGGGWGWGGGWTGWTGGGWTGGGWHGGGWHGGGWGGYHH